MPTSRPFTYDPSLSSITGAIRVFNSDLSIGVTPQDYSLMPGGVQWWNGPNEDPGYVIAHSVPTGTQPNPLGISAYVGFWRSSVLTENSFIQKAEYVSSKNYTIGDEAYIWMNGFGYWSSWVVNPGSLLFPNTVSTARFPSNIIGTMIETFTIEFWYKGDPTSTGGPQYIFGQSNTFGFGDLNLFIDPSDSRLHGLSTGGDISTPLTPNVWQHVAIICDNGQVKVFFDGVNSTAASVPNTLINNTIDSIYFGSRFGGATSFLDGKLTDVRICNIVVYQGAFNPPQSSLLPIQGPNPYGGINTAQINDGSCLLLIDSLNPSSFQRDLSNLGNAVVVGGITYAADSPY
jgi:hypothetical protein